jgi:large subunit ribosomal protein L15
MSSVLSRLRPPYASRTNRKRLGRGVGSGLGKTCGRGQKGQTSRAGKATGLARGFEGGQMPLQRRMPKRGFINPFRRELEVVNLRDLARFDTGAVVGPQELLERRLVRSIDIGVKILAVGELPHPLTVRAHAFSAAARRKIEAAGGTVEVIRPDVRAPVAEKTEASGS